MFDMHVGRHSDRIVKCVLYGHIIHVLLHASVNNNRNNIFQLTLNEIGFTIKTVIWIIVNYMHY